MSDPSHPSGQSTSSIAKETLIALGKRKLPATPTNYAQMYQQIASGLGIHAMTAHEAILLLTARLKDRQLADQLNEAADAEDWRSVSVALEQALKKVQPSAAENKTAPAPEPAGSSTVTVIAASDAVMPTSTSAAEDSARTIDLLNWIDLFVRQIKTAQHLFTLTQYSELLNILKMDANASDLRLRLNEWLKAWSESRLATAQPTPGIESAASLESSHFDPTASKFGTHADHDVADPRVLERLSELMQLLLLNIIEIVPESDVVQEQVTKIDDLLSKRLTLGRLDEIERAIRSMVVRGGIVRHGLEEAKEAIKSAVGKLIQRLASMSDATEGYTEKLTKHARHIAEASNMTSLSYQINDLLEDTEMLSSEMIKARSDFAEAQKNTQVLEQRTRQLEQEIAKLQKRVHTDPLTDTLDRRSMEEVYAEEIIRADRAGRALCLALIDIDDIKKLNQEHGNAITTEALKHLLEVISRMTRPTDSVARYGESKMAILLVGAKRDDAVMVMTRLIRELTKSFFMGNDQHVLLTFSCGVSQIDPKVGFGDAMDHAEAALKHALETGKNQVIGG